MVESGFLRTVYSVMGRQCSGCDLEVVGSNPGGTTLKYSHLSVQLL